MLKTIVENVASNLSEWIIYAAIAIISFIGLCKCILPVFRNASLLNSAVAKLEESTVEGDQPAWRDNKFLGKALRNEWKQFLQNAGQLSRRGIPCDTEDYINEESVIEKPGHSQLAELIPGLLTSLGILGTFLGLMQGLSTVDFNSSAATTGSISTMLTGMKFAFATSVAGISCSLLFNMLHRIAVGKATQALDNFEDAFYDLAMPRPLQSDVQMLCQKQDEDARVAQVMTDLGNQISLSIENAVGRAMVPLSHSLDVFIRGATQEQVDGIRRIAGQFVHEMNSSLSGEFTALGEALGHMGSAETKAQLQLEMSVNNVKDLNDQAYTIAKSCADTQELIRQMNDAIKADTEKRTMKTESYEFAANELAEKLQKLGDAVERLQETTDAITARLNAQNGGSYEE